MKDQIWMRADGEEVRLRRAQGNGLMDSGWRAEAAAFVLDELIQVLRQEPPGLRDLLVRVVPEGDLCTLVGVVGASPTSGRWATLSVEGQSSGGPMVVAIRLKPQTGGTVVIDYRVHPGTGRTDSLSLLPAEHFGGLQVQGGGEERGGAGSARPDIAAERLRRARSRRGDAMILTRRRRDPTGAS